MASVANPEEAPITAPGEKLAGSTAEDMQDTSSALDALLKSQENSEEGIPDETAEAAEKEAAEKAAAEAAEKEAAEKAAAESHDKTDEVPTPEEIAAAKAEKEKAAPVEDDMDKVVLPPYTKPKSVEAFATVKQIAKAKIAEVSKERDEIKAQLEAAQAAAKEVDPNIAKELEELRAFRLKFDVEADPSFNTYDKSIKENEELIYARLKTAGIDENSIKRIRELGGPANVDWEAIKDKIPASLMRYIEGKVFENGDLSEKKTKAIDAAKKNAAEFVKTRQEDLYNQTEGRAKTTKAEFEALKPRFDWAKPKAIPANAKPEEKAAIEAQNKVNAKILSDVDEALNDDSPQMRAILIAGYAQLMRAREDTNALVASHAAEVAKLKADIAEKDKFIATVKKSSTHRLTSKGTQPGDAPSKPKSNINEEPGDVIDRLLKETLAKQEA